MNKFTHRTFLDSFTKFQPLCIVNFIKINFMWKITESTFCYYPKLIHALNIKNNVHLLLPFVDKLLFDFLAKTCPKDYKSNVCKVFMKLSKHTNLKAYLNNYRHLSIYWFFWNLTRDLGVRAMLISLFCVLILPRWSLNR